MISNTSCSDLKLVKKVCFLPDEYQQMLEFGTSDPVNNNNNNNNTSNNKNMSSKPTILEMKTRKPFTFFTSGGVHTGDVGNMECSKILIEGSSDESIANNLISGFGVRSEEVVHYKPYNSVKAYDDNRQVFQNVHYDSALIGEGIGEDINAVVALTNEMDKASGDTSINGSNSNINSSKDNKSDISKLPMCRTQDQEDAFRQIEDVHNYSKLNRYGYCNSGIYQTADLTIYNSNSSDQDEDDEDEEEDDVEEENEDIVDYEKHLNAKAKILSEIGRQCNNITKNIKSLTSNRQHSAHNEGNIKVAGMEENVGLHEGVSTSTPDHHARRPMNAFLIFCKRHRGIVKDKYKNFENRSITKILGEWWASLDTNDKKCYVNLAKQNKDAFFSANPNFKWYKLPAPSLRTLNTRPGNSECQFQNSGEYQCDLNDPPAQTNLSCNTISPNSTYSRSALTKVAYFKFADEAQMGELNNLMRPTATTSTSEALQTALGETSDYFKTGYKRKSGSSFEDIVNTKALLNENSLSSSEDDLIPKKSARSCKGKKYQELINSGQISAVLSKKQVSPKPSGMAVSSTNDNEQFAIHNGQCNKVETPMKYETKSPKKLAQSKKTEDQYLLADFQDSYESPSKQHFGFVSFDLEDKIKTLPAQCLETYLQRKKNTKRKKKISSKKRQPKTETITSKESQQIQPKTAQEAKEHMVGSQKRKARKESITRRDIYSIQNEVQVLLTGSSVNSVIIGGGISAVQNNLVKVPQTVTTVNHNSNSDLLILAEVAANHTEIA